MDAASSLFRQNHTADSSPGIEPPDQDCLAFMARTVVVFGFPYIIEPEMTMQGRFPRSLPSLSGLQRHR